MEKLVYYLKQMLMIPQKNIRLFLIVLLAAALFAGCKKDEPEQPKPDSTPVQQLSKDDNSVEENMDEALVDAGQVVAGTGKSAAMDIPCGATLDSTYLVSDTIVYRLTYDGLNCAQNKYRTGTVLIKIKQNTSWFLPGAYITIELYDYEVTRLPGNQSMVINGRAQIENVNGGIVELLGNGFNAIIHKNSAHIHVVFNGHQPREWHLARMMVYSGSPGNLMLAVNGFGNAGSYSNLLSWGHDRSGKQFFTEIGESVVFRESCQWLPYAGEEIITIPEINLRATVTFGFNSNNQPVAGSECPTRYRLHWQQHGQSGTIFLPLISNN